MGLTGSGFEILDQARAETAQAAEIDAGDIG
jgi:hypothetical protein